MKVSQMKMITAELARAYMVMGVKKELLHRARMQKRWDIAKQLKIEISNFKKFSLSFIGESGIGKTEGIIQVATELHIPLYMFRVGEFVDNGDLQGMPKVRMKGNREVTMNMLPGFYPQAMVDEDGNDRLRNDGGIMYDYESNSDVIENFEELYDYYEGDVNQAPGCIIFFDELNRVAAPDVKQGLFRTFERYAIGSYQFPETSLLITATNPNTVDYSVDDIMEEKAFKTRFAHIEVKGDNKELAQHFEANNYNPYIVQLVKSHPEDINPEGEFYDLNIVCTSRNVDFMNTIMEYTNIQSLDYDLFAEMAAGILNPTVAAHLLSIIEDGTVTKVTGEEIITNYDSVREHILNATENGENDDFLNNAKDSFLTIVTDKNRVVTNYDDSLNQVDAGKFDLIANENNICQFFRDMPPEFRTAMVDEIARHDKIHPIFGKMNEFYEIISQDYEFYEQ